MTFIKLVGSGAYCPCGHRAQIQKCQPDEETREVPRCFFFVWWFRNTFSSFQATENTFFENFEVNQGFPDFFEKFLKKSAGFWNFL